MEYIIIKNKEEGVLQSREITKKTLTTETTPQPRPVPGPSGSEPDLVSSARPERETGPSLR
jgi:hypothetical protein